MAMTLNAASDHFDNLPIVDVSPQLDYDDAFIEYAYSQGLWGFGGETREPSNNEISEMRRQFADSWINLNGYNDDIDYMGVQNNNDDEDIVFPTNPEDEQMPHCHQCGVQACENVQLNASLNDEHIYCNGCWQEYQEEGPQTWTEIVEDFIDFAEHNEHAIIHWQDIMRAWNLYLAECFHPSARHWVDQIAETNEWVGIMSEEELISYREPPLSN